MWSAKSILEVKRYNKRPHTRGEIEWFINAFVKGATGASDKIEVKDYQMTAWLMAICVNGMTAEETSFLTQALVNSGDTLEWDFTENIRSVDKHSSGGVGDKVSLILAPLVASFDGSDRSSALRSPDGKLDAKLTMKVPMMAGRGLAHTGGTIDKLESIPGFRTQLTAAEFQQVVSSDVGVAIVSPTTSMVPADRFLYALRDVTSTVASIPLQTSSIMSKKIAERPQSLVLDVKYGAAGFQKTVEEAAEFAASLVETGERCGICPTTAFLTRMDQPLGRAIGNWLEVKECIHEMRPSSSDGENDADNSLEKLCCVLGGQMLVQSGAIHDGDDLHLLRYGVQECRHRIRSGPAMGKFKQMVEAQGGDTAVVNDTSLYPRKANFVVDVPAVDLPLSDDTTKCCYVATVDAMELGLLAVNIGAGRKIAEDDVNAVVGIYLRKKAGNSVRQGDVIATLHVDEEGELLESALQRIQKAFQYSVDPVKVPPLVTHIVTRKHGVQPIDMEQLFS